MKKVLLFAALALLVVACGSPEPIRVTPTAAAGTPTAPPPTVTRTPRPKATSTPRPTARPLVSCAKLNPDFVDALDDLAAEWDDADAIAMQSPRMSLAEPLAELQAIRRKVVKLADSAPECGADAALYAAVYMQFEIDLLLEFLGGDDPDAFAFQLAADSFSEYVTAYEGLYEDVWSE